MKNNIAEKISSVLENLDEKQRYYIFGGILLFVFLINYFVLMSPQLKSLSKINPEIKILKQDIKTADENMAKLSQYQKEVDQLKADLDKVNLRVKMRTEVPIILERISVLAEKNGIKVDQISPAPEKEEIVLENNQRRYYNLPVSIKARGTYHNFGRFVNDIENDGDMFISMGTFSIAKAADQKDHAITIILKAMVFEDIGQ